MNHRAECYCLLRHLLEFPILWQTEYQLPCFEQFICDWFKIARLAIVWSPSQTSRCEKVNNQVLICLKNRQLCFSTLWSNLVHDGVFLKLSFSYLSFYKRTRLCKQNKLKEVLVCTLCVRKTDLVKLSLSCSRLFISPSRALPAPFVRRRNNVTLKNKLRTCRRINKFKCNQNGMLCSHEHFLSSHRLSLHVQCQIIIKIINDNCCEASAMLHTQYFHDMDRLLIHICLSVFQDPAPCFSS